MRDWIVDFAIFAVAACSGVFVLSETWDAHPDSALAAIATLTALAAIRVSLSASRDVQQAALAGPGTGP